MNYSKFLIILTLIIFFIQSDFKLLSQELDSVNATKNTKSSFNKRNAVKVGIVANTAAIFYTQYKWWWEDDYHPFHCHWEGYFNNYSKGIDKLGHAYISYLYFKTFYSVMKWADYKEKDAIKYSVGIPLLYAVSVEMGDGFSSYQFSPDDLLSNIAGIGFAYLQTRNNISKNIQFKWSYYPSEFNPWQKKKLSITDDYDGHIYWLSFDVKNILGEKYNQFWPKYINLALGYGADGVSKGNNDLKRREFIVGLDINLNHIQSKNKKTRNFIDVLNTYRLPLPAIKFKENSQTEYKMFLMH
ncbi:MAG: hypothetical protein A2X12_05670 [Bacteroidetes bacterium GWE2_29_8]|nr:MAG: hypothetical protein A2X12_05670 [Bacteroidetes bacterium GWE2_29_8]OFY23755.1 MAG: hypothetical protein A2X02_03540 [Bacteroidetes bacterium GWF2_29_10]